MKKFKVSTIEEFQTKVANYDTLDIADALLESIAKGIKNNSKKVAVCDVEIEEEQEIFRLYSSKEDWPIALEGCIKTFINSEEYEKCIEVQKLLKEYESKKVVSKKSNRGRKPSKTVDSSD
jgi:hypothetical protein